jgi:signal transduction histidine kinase
VYGFVRPRRQIVGGSASATRADRLRPYAISLLWIVAATVATLVAKPLLGGRGPLFFLTVAVIVSAVRGLGPGLLATALSVGSVLLLVRERVLVLLLLRPRLVLFAIIGVGISVIMGRLQKANAALAQTQRALETANKQLSEHSRTLAQTNEELRRFAYSLAHDLSTPVRSIAALTDLLVQRNAAKLDDSSKECAALITNKATRIQAMINGLLDYAAAIDKSDTAVSANASLAVQKALQDLDSVIRATAAQITVAGELPFVAVVESQLIQVFSNLISNAMKYCHRGRIPHIHISAAAVGDDVVFCVRDNGIGIDMQYSGTIFGMFQRLHGDEYEGRGIGLALCKAIVESRGGRIWLESQPGNGSAFYFTLPKARPAPATGSTDSINRSVAASA